MAWVAVAGAAVAAVGTAVSADSSRKAAHTQADAARDAASQNAAMQKPWVDAGSAALDRLSTGLAPGGEYTKQFTMADAQTSEAEKVAQNRASTAVQNSAAAKGGLIGSNVLDQLQTTAGEIGASYENQAFNQWNTQQARQLAAQQSLAQVGQTATTNVADTNANATLAAGGANAGATVATGNAINSGIGQLGNILGQSKLFDPSSSSSSSLSTGGGGIDTGSISYLGGSSTAGDYSDERLKEGAKRVGFTDDGMPIYTYRMRMGGPRKMGVMAQDMEKTKPSAVTKDAQGFRMVDYGKVS